MKLKPIEEQVVVLMGASSGIGRLAAKEFARRGARVVLSARGCEDLEEVAREIRDDGGEAHVIAADTTDFQQIKAVADGAVERYGRLDTWVQLAGVGLWSLLEETTPEEWARVIDVNLNGQAYGAMAAIPHLRRGGGALIHVSSVEARLAVPFQTAYAAAKHGVHGLVKSLRLELRGEGAPISVTEIMPAGTDTPIFDEARTRLGVKPMPIPPVYSPHIAAGAILYAAEHPVREMVLGGFSKAGMALQSVAPSLLDAFMLFAGFRLQKTDERKSDEAPTNLFQREEADGSVRGSLGGRSFSTYAWLEMHPVVKTALAAALIGAAAVAGAGALRALACSEADRS
jgi:NAD(P)-dependent dehydrogenase (short-subunit alcohol dehydrogenase family)